METYIVIKKQDLEERLSPVELKQFHNILLLLNNLVEYDKYSLVPSEDPFYEEVLTRCSSK